MQRKSYILLLTVLSILTLNLCAMRYIDNSKDKINGEERFPIEWINKDAKNGFEFGLYVPRKREILLAKCYERIVKEKLEIICEKFLDHKERFELIGDLVERNYTLSSILKTGESVTQARERLNHEYSTEYKRNATKVELLDVLVNLKRQKIFILKNENLKKYKFNEKINYLEAKDIEEKVLSEKCFYWYQKEDYSREDVLKMVQEQEEELNNNFDSLTQKEQAHNLYKKFQLRNKILEFCDFSV